MLTSALIFFGWLTLLDFCQGIARIIKKYSGENDIPAGVFWIVCAVIGTACMIYGQVMLWKLVYPETP